MKDEDIDLSDIPAIIDWSRAVRGKFYRSPLALYCADIGSVKSNRFGWYGVTPTAEGAGGNDIHQLVSAVAERLKDSQPVALGFECPLFVPISVDANGLTSARFGEGNRAWCAGAGSGSLATGLVEVVWILREIRKKMGRNRRAFLDWEEFRKHRRGLFLWEAFVSGKGKSSTDMGDAELAVRSFCKALPKPQNVSAVKCAEGIETYSLIGAALLRSGWSNDVRLLSQPCLVMKENWWDREPAIRDADCEVK